jgi:hypothetical protein
MSRDLFTEDGEWEHERYSASSAVREMLTRAQWKSLCIPIITADIKNSERTFSHTLLVGVQNGIATVQNDLAASYNTGHMITIKLDNSIPRHLSQRTDNI